MFFPRSPNHVTHASQVFLPRFCSAGKLYNDLFSTKFRSAVFSNGDVILVGGGRLTTSCALDMTYFPFDHQTCWLEVSAVTQSTQEAHKKPGSLGPSDP